MTGVDIDVATLAHARAVYADRRNVEFVEGSATSLPLANASVDVAVSFETIEHLDAADQPRMLAEFARDGLVRVMFSIPTLDNDMKRVLEPRAAAASARLKAMRVLSDASVPVGVLVAPIIPVLTEHEIEAVLEASRVQEAA